MSPHYESTAHLLLILMRCGLKAQPNVDYRSIINRLVDRFTYLHRDAKGLTHSGAAVWILDDLIAAKMVACDEEKVPRVLAILGNGVANVEYQSRAQASVWRNGYARQ